MSTFKVQTKEKPKWLARAYLGFFLVLNCELFQLLIGLLCHSVFIKFSNFFSVLFFCFFVDLMGLVGTIKIPQVFSFVITSVDSCHISNFRISSPWFYKLNTPREIMGGSPIGIC